MEFEEDEYSKCYANDTYPFEGIPEALGGLKERKIRLGVLSNKQDHYVKALCKNLLSDDVCDAAQGMILGKPAKPNPYLSHRLADALGVSPTDCILVGDSDVDVKTAHNAGMLHVGVAWGYRDEACLREAGADRIAHTPEELENMIMDIKRKGESLC